MTYSSPKQERELFDKLRSSREVKLSKEEFELLKSYSFAGIEIISPEDRKRYEIAKIKSKEAGDKSSNASYEFYTFRKSLFNRLFKKKEMKDLEYRMYTQSIASDEVWRDKENNYYLEHGGRQESTTPCDHFDSAGYSFAEVEGIEDKVFIELLEEERAEGRMEVSPRGEISYIKQIPIQNYSQFFEELLSKLDRLSDRAAEAIANQGIVIIGTYSDEDSKGIPEDSPNSVVYVRDAAHNYNGLMCFKHLGPFSYLLIPVTPQQIDLKIRDHKFNGEIGLNFNPKLEHLTLKNIDAKSKKELKKVFPEISIY